MYTFQLSFHIHHCDSTVCLNSVPQDGWTSLIYASYNGDTNVVQLLLSAGAQVDLGDTVVRHNINLRILSLCIANATF